MHIDTSIYCRASSRASSAMASRYGTSYNLLQDLDLDETSLSSTAKQIRESMHKQMIRNVDFFRMLDKDMNGFVTRPELEQGFEQLGMGAIPEKYLDTIFNEFDMDKSGRIQYEELRSILQRDKLDVEELSPEELAHMRGEPWPPPGGVPESVGEPEPSPLPAIKKVPPSLKTLARVSKLSNESFSKPTAHPLLFNKIRIVLPGAKPTYDAYENRAVYDDTKAFDAYELINDVCGTNRGSAQLAIVTHPLQETSGDMPGVVVRHRPFHHRLASAGWSIIAYDAHPLGAEGDGEAEAAKLRGVMAYVAKHVKFRYCRCALVAQGTAASAAFKATYLDPDSFDAIKVISACQPSGTPELREALIEEYAPKCSLPVIVTAAASSTVTPETVIARKLHYAVQGAKKAIQIPPSYPLYGAQRRFEGTQYFADHPAKLINFMDEHSQPTNVKQRRVKQVTRFGKLRALRESQSGLLTSYRAGLLRRPQSASSEIRLDHEGDGELSLQTSASMPVLDPIKREGEGGEELADDAGDGGE